MHLFHFQKKDKLLNNCRLVFRGAGPSEDGRLDSAETNINGGGKTELEITARDVDSGKNYLDNQVSTLLDHVENFDGGAKDRMHKLLGHVSQSSNDKHVDNAVHDYHEGEAEGVISRANEKLDEAAIDTTHKVKLIRKGRVDKWGEGEVAMASQKLTELRRSKENLNSAITQNRTRAKNYSAFLSALRDPDLSERFWSKARTRISKKRFKTLSSDQPERFNELNKAKASVQRVESKTNRDKKAYEARHRQEFKKSREVSNKFKSYLLSIPAFSKDKELKDRFDEFLGQDQLAGFAYDKGEIMTRVNKAFLDGALTSQEMSVLIELYSSLFTDKDVKMRKMEAAMNLKTKVDKINRKTLKKMPAGQVLTVNYPAISAINVGNDGKRTIATSNIAQTAYVHSNQGGKLVLQVQYSDINKLGKIKRTDVKSYDGPLSGISDTKEVTEYTPKAQIIEIDLNTGEMKSSMEAMYTNKKGKAAGVTLRDSRKFESDDENGAFKGINFAGDILNEAITK